MSSNHDAGYYSEIVAADSRRKEFNIKIILYSILNKSQILSLQGIRLHTSGNSTHILETLTILLLIEELQVIIPLI